MKYSVRFDHIEVSDWDREQMDHKLQRLDKRVREPYVLDVTLAHSTHHQTGSVVECRLTLEQGKNVFHVDRKADSVQSALDRCLEALIAKLEHTHGKRSSLEKGHRRG